MPEFDPLGSPALAHAGNTPPESMRIPVRHVKRAKVFCSPSRILRSNLPVIRLEFTSCRSRGQIHFHQCLTEKRPGILSITQPLPFLQPSAGQQLPSATTVAAVKSSSACTVKIAFAVVECATCSDSWRAFQEWRRRPGSRIRRDNTSAHTPAFTSETERRIEADPFGLRRPAQK